MPLGKEVGHIVLDGGAQSPQQPLPTFWLLAQYMFVVANRSPVSATAELLFKMPSH